MARTALFARLRRALALARVANTTERAVSELVEMTHVPRPRRISRRRFLHAGAATLGGVALAPVFSGCRSLDLFPRRTTARVSIVGGGLAGLNAAYRLQTAGVTATVYEAASRSGGRVYTARNLLGPGLTTELGGEFIDSDHEEMLALASEFELDLLDTAAAGEAALIREAYYFDGQFYSEAAVVEAFRPVAARLDADCNALGGAVDFEHGSRAAALDRTSLAEYFDRIGVSGFLRKLLDVAYVTEYGLDSGEQSALNLLFLISTDVSHGRFEVLGESDERYKIRGGNQRLVDELAARLAPQIRREHRLEAIRARGAGFTLTFARPGQSAVHIDTDVVLLAIPFTLLRAVKFQDIPLSPAKRRAIDELGYGTNAKVMLGFQRRLWREQGHSGNVYTDQPLQLAWDNSRLQDGRAGGLTLYSGGAAGVQVGSGTPEDQAGRLLPGLERIFPGTGPARNGSAARFHWPSYEFTRGSYACYRPGQWTTIAGAEGRPEGNLYFAGEHCSRDYQGFMNGAAQTGRLAAAAILARLAGVPAPAAARRRFAYRG